MDTNKKKNCPNTNGKSLPINPLVLKQNSELL